MLNKISFKNQLQNLANLPENHTYLLAVSGGVDSMVLAALFHDLGVKFQVAHINYKLRGEDSELDQKVVQDFCEKNHIKFNVYEVSEKDNKPENSIQLWARKLRYNFFKQIQEQENLEFLVTAHHLNDQLETFIINLSKAAGIKGLSGIPANNNSILRPLLNFTKEEIYDFAKENTIEFREDLSNKKSDYLRNKIRNEIVPKLLEINDHFLENFKKSASYLNQTKDFVQKEIQHKIKSFTISNDECIVLDKQKISEESDFVKFEILRKFGFNDEKEMLKIFTAETGKKFISKDFELIINRNELIFSTSIISDTLNENPKEIILSVNENQEIILSEKLKFQVSDFTSLEWHFDVEKVNFPLKLRKKKEGDLFFPIGMTGKKKVSKFLKDEKLSILEKEKIWLLCDTQDVVLGVLPYRQDQRFSANEHTHKLLTVKWMKKDDQIC